MRPGIPPSIFNVPASCLPSPKPAPRPAKVKDQQLRYFLPKDKITSFDAFKPERNLQKQYKNLIISRSKERLVCLFMTDYFTHTSAYVDTEKDKKLVFLTRQLELLSQKLFSMNDYYFALQSYPKCNYEQLRDFLVLPCKRKLQYITSSIDKDQASSNAISTALTFKREVDEACAEAYAGPIGAEYKVREGGSGACNTSTVHPQSAGASQESTDSLAPDIFCANSNVEVRPPDGLVTQPFLRDFLVLPCKRKLQYITSSIDKDQVLRETFDKVQTLQQKNVFLLVDEVQIHLTVSFSGGLLSGMDENNRDCKATFILITRQFDGRERQQKLLFNPITEFDSNLDTCDDDDTSTTDHDVMPTIGINMAIVNAWLLYSKHAAALSIAKKETVPLASFKLHLAFSLTKSGKVSHTSDRVDTEKEKKLVFLTRQLELLSQKQFSMNDNCFALQSYPKCNYEQLRDFLVLPCKRKLKYITSSIDKDQVLRETFDKVQTLQQKNVFLLVDEEQIRPTVSISGGLPSGMAENNRDCKATFILITRSSTTGSPTGQGIHIARPVLCASPSDKQPRYTAACSAGRFRLHRDSVTVSADVSPPPTMQRHGKFTSPRCSQHYTSYIRRLQNRQANSLTSGEPRNSTTGSPTTKASAWPAPFSLHYE
ncbi:hypothetical protein FHG87_022094 [Trinorchestia longiramus]|nr:hypothetical protein FHG87_022094 [Trinorchestia longiramus]